MIISLFGFGNDFLLMLAFVLAFLSALFISMPAHEYAHAKVALKEGDHTAKVLGRCTPAPFVHIDWKGLLLLLFFGVGFAKPVPVDTRNLKNGKKSEIKVAIAGVLTNLVIGVVSVIVFALLCVVWPELFTSYGFISDLYYYFFNFMISLNFMFVFFNILPIYPLDGFRVVEACSKPFNKYVEFMKRYGFIVMLVVVCTSLSSIYLNYTADLLSNVLFEGVYKLFKLIF